LGSFITVIVDVPGGKVNPICYNGR
jgi:hypothetical protein